MSSKGSHDSDTSDSDASSGSVASDALVKNIPKRATRGVRKKALAGEAAQADEEFWGQRAFGEPESDSEFSSIAATTDSSDSDIDEPEPDEKADARAEREAAAAAKMAEAMMGPVKRNVYVDPALRRKKAAAARRAAAAAAAAPKSSQPRAAAAPLPATMAGQRSRRSSTLEATAGAEARSAAAPATSVGGDPSARGGGSVAAPPRATQAELLQAAATTTLDNLLALATGRAGDGAAGGVNSKTGKRAAKTGQRVVFRSARGHGDLLTFKGVDDFPPLINSKAPPAPPRAVCAVSGAAAKHRCPVSWLPYAGPSEFRRLRRRLARRQLFPQAASPLGRGVIVCPTPPPAHSSDDDSGNEQPVSLPWAGQNEDGPVVRDEGVQGGAAAAAQPGTPAPSSGKKPNAAVVMAAARAAIAAAKAASASAESSPASADDAKQVRGRGGSRGGARTKPAASGRGGRKRTRGE